MMGRMQFGNRPDGNDEMGLRNAEGEDEAVDAKLQQTLTDFRASVHAWSEAAYTRPRTLEMIVRRRSWRLAAGWALGCALVAGGVTGGVIEHQRQQEAARIAAQQAQEQQLAAARERAREEDRNLMAKVDSDTSQEVPDAMEPLAQLMADAGTQ